MNINIIIIFILFFLIFSCYDYKEFATIINIEKENEDYWKYDYYIITFKTISNKHIIWNISYFHDSYLEYEIGDTGILYYYKKNSGSIFYFRKE